LATGSDAKIQLWSRGGKLIKTFGGFNDSIDSISFSPDSKNLAIGSNNVVQLWGDSGKLLKTLKGHGVGAIRSVSFSPNGDILATGSTDNTVKL
jgi:WD40 repeat protein